LVGRAIVTGAGSGIGRATGRAIGLLRVPSEFMADTSELGLVTRNLMRKGLSTSVALSTVCDEAQVKKTCPGDAMDASEKIGHSGHIAGICQHRGKAIHRNSKTSERWDTVLR